MLASASSASAQAPAATFPPTKVEKTSEAPSGANFATKAVQRPPLGLISVWAAFFNGRSSELDPPEMYAEPDLSTTKPEQRSPPLPPKYVENSRPPAGATLARKHL